MKQALYGWAYISDLPRSLQVPGKLWYAISLIGRFDNKYVRAKIGKKSFTMYGRMICRTDPTKGRRDRRISHFSLKNINSLRLVDISSLSKLQRKDF